MQLPETGKGAPWPLPTKALRIMRITAFLLLAASLHVTARSLAQNISLSEKDAPLSRVIEEIQAKSGLSIVYDNILLGHARHVSIDVKDMPVMKVLDLVLNGQFLDYVLEDKIIFIRAKEPSAAKTGEDQASAVTSRPVRGTVKSAAGISLEGVSVVIKSNTFHLGAATDSRGRFVIYNVPDGSYTIEVTMVGYRKYQKPVTVNGSLPDQDVSLSPEASDLDEMVVVGYGSTRKKDLTGSVSTISIKDVQDIPFTTVDNALAGKAAGVEVTKTDGTPGGAVRIRVRGSTSLLGGNDPLYVIDGVPVQVQSSYIKTGYDVPSPVGVDITGNVQVAAGMQTAFVNGINTLTGLNPNDIESISILKDASSTAIYGSKAANGVVIITTKKGKKNMAPQITFNDNNTITTPKNPKLLNGTQYKMLLTEAAQNDYDYRSGAGLTISPDLDAILNHPDTYFGKANTNWLDEVTRTTFSNNAELAVQGGGTSSRYYSSIGYNSTPGVVRGSDYQRISGKLNLENEIGKHFRFLTNLDLGWVNQNITNGAYGQALRARPDYTPYDSTGNFTSFAGVGQIYQGFQNPVADLTAIDNAKTFSLLGSVSGIYDITSGLEFKSTASLNMQNYTQRNYTPSYLNIEATYGPGTTSGGIGSNSNSQLSNWFIENTLTYDKTFHEKHTLNVVAGTSYETRKASFFSSTAAGYPNDNVLNNLSSATTPVFTQGDNPSGPQSYLISYYMRANYGYMDKYLFTFTGRTDGSSKFGPDNKYGYFPSGAIAWRISQENFLKKVRWIEDIKLRGSYGLTGTQNIGDQMYRTLYTPYAYAGTSALVPTQLGNSAIKWETTRETDGGLDFSLFRGRLQGTVDYYKKQTDGALLSVPVAPSSSFSSLLNNSVNLRNTGFEVSLQGDIIKTRDFRWNVSVNVTWNKSLVTKLNPGADLTQIGNTTGLEIGNTAIIQGKPLGLFTGQNVTGLIRTQKQLDDYKAKLNELAGSYPYLGIGDPMFQLDTVTYAAYNSAYPQYNAIIGNAAPAYFGGFTQGFSYKNFDLNFYFTFSEGGHLLWGDDISSLKFVGTSNANVVMLNRYTPDHTNTDDPRLVLDDEVMNNTSLSVFKSSYIKLRTLTLNYRFDKSSWMQRAGIMNASVYLSATNLFTITKYPGNDPETSDDPYSVGGGYFDVSNYPPVKTFSVGLKAGF
jgi:TonB-linked SusC/RagA family outer membrane protein